MLINRFGHALEASANAEKRAERTKRGTILRFRQEVPLRSLPQPTADRLSSGFRIEQVGRAAPEGRAVPAPAPHLLFPLLHSLHGSISRPQTANRETLITLKSVPSLRRKSLLRHSSTANIAEKAHSIGIRRTGRLHAPSRWREFCLEGI